MAASSHCKSSRKSAKGWSGRANTLMQNLMLIGAYRDNEVRAAHPLMRKLGDIKAAGCIPLSECGGDARTSAQPHDRG